MKKLFSSTKAYLLLAGVAALMASCQDYEPANEQMTKEAAYNYEFERQFGPVDPNHDWSMATRVTANIDLSDAPEGTYEVKIFSEKNGYLLTKAIVENSAQISFDAIKGESSVRILARKTSALGLSVINGYFPIVDGEVNTAKEGTRAPSTATQCNTTVGDQIDLGTTTKQGEIVDVYQRQNGTVNDGGNDFKATLPTDDNVYYYTKMEGQSYGDGDNGTYSVTYNGETSTMDMHAIGDIIDDQTLSKRYYEETDAVYQFKAANGDHYGNYVTELPSDNKYYITPIEGEDYSNGADGKYSVTLNGTTTEMTMHEISDIITSRNFLMYKTETRTIYSDDQTNWKDEYNSSPDKQTEYIYVAQAGDFGEGNGTKLDALPNDGTYYITKIAGEDYSDGSNGKYSVYYNGTTSQMDMYEVADIISNCKPYTLLESGKYSITYYGSPAYYKVNRYYLSVEGYNLAGGQYVTPAYYEKTKDAGFTIAPAVVHAPYYQRQSQNVTVKWAGDFYYLNDVYKSIESSTQVKFDDLLPLVSSNSAYDPIFHEADDNRAKFEEVLDFNVELVLTEPGPMTYTYVFYGSIHHNKLGYFYWNETEGMTDEEKKQARINAPRYVLMDDTYPTEVQSETGKPNLQCYGDQNGTNPHTPGGMEMPTWVDDGIAAHTGHYLQGTTYHMVYFGENYDEPASYEFPEGLHVAFFLLTQWPREIPGYGLFYSIQDMNEDQEVFHFKGDMENNYIVNQKHWWSSSTDPNSEERMGVGEVAAVFYSYNGNMVMGFEDDVDKDENDMLFLISAPVEPPVELTTEEEITWIVACEDLGGTYDYDFNDLVFEVTLHTTTTETSTSGGSSAGSSVSFSSEVLFRPLAAGGTLPAKVYLGETEIGEIHALLGGSGTSTSTPINVGPKGSSVSLSGLDPTPVNTGETYYTSIASVLEDIKIVVTNEGNKDATEITAPNQDKTSNIPQMLLLPKGWDWPTEQTHIYNVYPEFENWATDMTKNGWIKDPSTNSIDASYYMVNPFK